MVVPITLSDVESVVGASGRVMVAPPGTPGSRMPLTVAIRGHQLAVCEQDAETGVPAGWVLSLRSRNGHRYPNAAIANRDAALRMVSEFVRRAQQVPPVVRGA
jgi:hypothetical protein